MNKKALIAGIVVLALVLIAGLGFIVYKSTAPAAPLDETQQTLPTEETPPATFEDPQLATEEMPTEETPKETEDTAPEIVTDEENNEWASLPTSDTYPDIPEITTAPTTPQPTEEPEETTAPTGVNGEELPGLGENDTPWN